MRYTPPGGRKLTRRRMRKKRDKHERAAPKVVTVFAWAFDQQGSFYDEATVAMWADRPSGD